MNSENYVPKINTNKRTVLIFFLIFAGVILTASLIISPLSKKENANPEITATNNNNDLNTSKTINNITLIVDYNNGTIETILNISLVEINSTVFDLLILYYNIRFVEYDFGILLTSINSVKENPQTGEYWQYWINDTYAQVGITSYQIQINDVIKWLFAPQSYL